MDKLIDKFGRTINYLRLSVTDRCNLRCVYCMPGCGVKWVARGDVLRFEEIHHIVRVGASVGLTRVRLTGGEPLVREGVVELVRMLSKVSGLAGLALTTNGVLLSRFARSLAHARLRRINISLDTLRPDRFSQITRFGSLSDVLSGIEAALEAGLNPVKLNVVVIRGVNDDEIVEMARLTIDRPLHVRFIELMPIGGYFTHERFFPQHEILERLMELGRLNPIASAVGCGPAKTFALNGSRGTIGLIGALTQAFCAQCNRLRLTATGLLRPCLDQDCGIDITPALRPFVDRERIADLLREAVSAKPKQHQMAIRKADPVRFCMSGIGG